MSVSHQIAFVHHLVFGNQSLVESICPRCGKFVAASMSPGVLKIAEAAHACPGLFVSGPAPVCLKLKRSN